MASPELQYAELKPQIGAIANELFALSETFLKNQGNFVPHAAVLTEEGAIRLVAADPTGRGGQTNSTEVLPLLHAGLREQARTGSLSAIGVAENVTVTLEGQKPTKVASDARPPPWTTLHRCQHRAPARASGISHGAYLARDPFQGDPASGRQGVQASA